jgi:hypothetical protein
MEDTMHDRTVFLNGGMEAGLEGLVEDACPYLLKSRERAPLDRGLELRGRRVGERLNQERAGWMIAGECWP